MSEERKTIMACLDHTAERFPNRPALQQKIKGSWTAITWSEYRRGIRQAAKAMIHLGLEAGDGVSIIGFNCPEWAIGDLAAIWAGEGIRVNAVCPTSVEAAADRPMPGIQVKERTRTPTL